MISNAMINNDKGENRVPIAPNTILNAKWVNLIKGRNLLDPVQSLPFNPLPNDKF